MFVSVALVVASLAPSAPPGFELKEGDRVVWIGSTLVEREQRYGYWETALHAAFPDRRFTLRNLGWSGDTVFGEARGRFDFNNPDACFKQLVDQTLALKPTVIFVSYGTNESFEGEAGLPRFEKGLEKLLDALKPANARIVLFSPLPFEPLAGVPGTEERNRMIARYAGVVRATAERQGLWFSDTHGEFHQLYRDLLRLWEERWTKRGEPTRLTDNGLHLTEEGYRLSADRFLASVGLTPAVRDPKQLAPLRAAIVAKNELFFHRWRPQNETYLFGFRKHEQGRNAKEVAEFDPLVAKAEDEIDRTRKTLTR